MSFDSKTISFIDRYDKTYKLHAFSYESLRKVCIYICMYLIVHFSCGERRKRKEKERSTSATISSILFQLFLTCFSKNGEQNIAINERWHREWTTVSPLAGIFSTLRGKDGNSSLSIAARYRGTNIFEEFDRCTGVTWVIDSCFRVTTWKIEYGCTTVPQIDILLALFVSIQSWTSQWNIRKYWIVRFER